MNAGLLVCYVLLPRFQLGNVVLIAAPGAVDAAANLVDVRGDSADGGSQLLLLGVIYFDDVPVDQHLAGIRPEVVRPQLAHFVLDEIQFLLVQADFLADGSRAIRHDKTLLSQYNGHFFSKTWHPFSKNFSCL